MNLANDLISRKKAIAVLNDVSEHYTDEGREWHPHVDFMVEAIKELPSEPTHKWIPCDIMYPDMDERVLVFTVGHEYHVWDCMSNRSDNYFWEDEVGLFHNKYEVDLWMPIPDPYMDASL